MNTKSLQYQNDFNSSLEIAIQPQNGFFKALINKVTALVAPGHIEQSEAAYRAQHARAVKAEMGRDIVRSLPTTEKLRLGMYHFMD